LLTDAPDDRLSLWMKDILFKENVDHQNEEYAHLCVVCLRLHPTLIESNLSLIVDELESGFGIFFFGYVDLYAQMRSLSKLSKRLSNVFKIETVLPASVLDQ
jgi:hypothetical protein